MQTKFFALERRVLDAVMLLTYFQGLKKAEMTLEDIRLLVADDEVRPNRVQKAFNRLVSGKVLKIDQHANGKQFIGLDKDYERWSLTDGADIMSTISSNSILKATNALNQHMTDIMSAAERLLEEVKKKYGIKYNIKQRGVERGMAKALLDDATYLAKSPKAGTEALRDYFSYLYKQEWTSGLRMPFTYAMGNFTAWYKSLPSKPNSIKEDERVTGYHYWWNDWNKDWEMNRDRPIGEQDDGN